MPPRKSFAKKEGKNKSVMFKGRRFRPKIKTARKLRITKATKTKWLQNKQMMMKGFGTKMRKSAKVKIVSKKKAKRKVQKMKSDHHQQKSLG